jgi:ribosomal protein S12 methylthiotransferase
MNSKPTSAAPSSPTRLADTPRAPKISFVSLGCPKALVDSERIIGRLRAEGYELAKTHPDAAAVIVNTCGFLDSAKGESLAAIGATQTSPRFVGHSFVIADRIIRPKILHIKPL